MTIKTHTITLNPLNKTLKAKHGSALRDLLFEQGVEFPCGGMGRCRGCKVRILRGNAAVTDLERELLSKLDISQGWRLSCKTVVEDDLVIELRQWDATILVNDTEFAFTPLPGFGIAVDLGTTTLAAQLLDRTTGKTLAVKTALNPQAKFGSDVMSRVQVAVAENGGSELQSVIREQIGQMLLDLLVESKVNPGDLKKITIVGNSVMHHLFSGFDVEPFSRYPFESERDGLASFTAEELLWLGIGDPIIEFLPGLGSFVGSDILAGVLATGMHQSKQLVALVDLGTNGEIVVGNRDRLICASTAAGPAFEGAKIWMGMRAATGAIWKVIAQDGTFHCEVIGSAKPRGICGSGLVDAVAAALDLGLIKATGRLNNGSDRLLLQDPVLLSQTDIRQLQLAKGAIAAGIRILLQRWGASENELSCLYLAGAFGNYISRQSARRIGLLDFPEEKVEPVGNSALLGAKMALFADSNEHKALRGLTTHFSLNADPQFQEIYVDEMGFPSQV